MSFFKNNFIWNAGASECKQIAQHDLQMISVIKKFWYGF